MSTTDLTNDDLAFKVIQEISGNKYAYESTVRDAIHYVAHRHGIEICKQKENSIYELVSYGLKRINYYQFIGT